MTWRHDNLWERLVNNRRLRVTCYIAIVTTISLGLQIALAWAK